MLNRVLAVFLWVDCCDEAGKLHFCWGVDSVVLKAKKQICQKIVRRYSHKHF